MTVATTSTEECSASEISASEPIAIPTANFAAAMPALAKIEIAATLALRLEAWAWLVVMRGGLAGRQATSSGHPQAQSRVVGRSRFVANCSDLRVYPRHCEERSDEAIH